MLPQKARSNENPLQKCNPPPPPKKKKKLNKDSMEEIIPDRALKKERA